MGFWGFFFYTLRVTISFCKEFGCWRVFKSCCMSYIGVRQTANINNQTVNTCCCTQSYPDDIHQLLHPLGLEEPARQEAFHRRHQQGADALRRSEARLREKQRASHRTVSSK